MNDASALHILLVDSRPDPVLARELEAKDPLMVVSGDGHEALSLILRARTTAPFTLVISALSLPGLDGLTLFRDLRRRQESMRLAFVLRPAELTPDLRHTCLKLECLPSLLRPVNVQAIGELLAAAQRSRGAAKEDGEPFFGTTTQRFRARGVSAAQPGADGDDAQAAAQGAPWQGGGQDALVAAPLVPPPMPSPVPGPRPRRPGPAGRTPAALGGLAVADPNPRHAAPAPGRHPGRSPAGARPAAPPRAARRLFAGQRAGPARHPHSAAAGNPPATGRAASTATGRAASGRPPAADGPRP